jgi:hypothetical protein
MSFSYMRLQEVQRTIGRLKKMGRHKRVESGLGARIILVAHPTSFID